MAALAYSLASLRHASVLLCCLLGLATITPALASTGGQFPALLKAGTAAEGPVAVAIYAPPAFARSLRCEALIESLRSQGQYNGRLYFITEELKCFQHERWLQCGLDADMVILDDGQAVEQVSKIKGTATTLRWWRWVNTAWQAYKSRLVRAHLWSLLQPSSSVEAIVYIHGCDMLVGSSLDSFIHEGLKRLRSPDAPMVVLASQQPTGAQHAGSPTTAKEAERAMGGPGHVWMVHRRASAQFLAAWSDLVLSSPSPRIDEDALLLSAMQKAGGPACQGAGALGCLQRYLVPLSGVSRTLECDKQLGCGFNTPAVFNHVPESVCSRVPHEMVRDWVEALDLCVYQDISYCMPRFMHVFANAWLPYPKCAKFELGLSRLACQWTCTDPTVMRSPRFRTTVTKRPLLLD